MKALPHISLTLAAGAALALLAGCTPLAPNLDADFGKSVRALQAYQTINAEAAENTANPAMDGRAAQETTGRYYKSYSTPAAQPNVFTIGVGGAR